MMKNKISFSINIHNIQIKFEYTKMEILREST